MDTPDTPPSSALQSRHTRSWLLLLGGIVTAGSIFAFVLLFALDFLSPNSNPYVGVLAYLVAPVFFFFGVALMLLGYLLRRRHLLKQQLTGLRPLLLFDLSSARERRKFFIFLGAAVAFLLVTAIGSYHSYHYTESVQFCGQACHQVMQPEFTTYLHSPHARVSCAECHIGSGATWYVKAKISGLYQVYATLFDKYERPIRAPIANLRPAQETCEQCHWPQKFVGNLDKTFQHYLSDKESTPYTVRLSLKVGGADPTHGPVGGIHWHMSVANKVEYIALDDENQKIPWVRVTNPQGVVTVYKTDSFTNSPSHYTIHQMDCMDCHNQPSHIFQSPSRAVDIALSLGELDRSMPYIKKEAVDVLVQPYKTTTQALEKIATTLHAKYATNAHIAQAIATIQNIYTNNFFPEMKASWKVYPDNIGHKDWPGCFRCHDGEHKSADGKRAIPANNCNACHLIIAEGKGASAEHLSPKGEPFKHPEEGWEGFQCTDCHASSD